MQLSISKYCTPECLGRRYYSYRQQQCIDQLVYNRLGRWCGTTLISVMSLKDIFSKIFQIYKYQQNVSLSQYYFGYKENPDKARVKAEPYQYIGALVGAQKSQIVAFILLIFELYNTASVFFLKILTQSRTELAALLC